MKLHQILEEYTSLRSLSSKHKDRKKFKVTFNNGKSRTVWALKAKDAKDRAMHETGRPSDHAIIGVKKVEEIK